MRGDQARSDFHRARDESVVPKEKVASLKEEKAIQSTAVVTAERSRKDVIALCKDLEEKIKFKDVVHREELKELAAGKETVDSCQSQARIAWDQHEKVSNELVVVRNELEKARADL